MAGYSAAFRTPLLINSSPVPRAICDIRTSATDKLAVLEIYGSLLNASNATVMVGVARPSSLGTAIANSIAFLPHDANSPPCTATVGLDWTTLPGSPTAYVRRIICQTNTTSSAHFRFLFKELSISPSSSIVLWLTGGNIGPLIPSSMELTVEIDV